MKKKHYVAAAVAFTITFWCPSLPAEETYYDTKGNKISYAEYKQLIDNWNSKIKETTDARMNTLMDELQDEEALWKEPDGSGEMDPEKTRKKRIAQWKKKARR